MTAVAATVRVPASGVVLDVDAARDAMQAISRVVPEIGEVDRAQIVETVLAAWRGRAHIALGFSDDDEGWALCCCELLGEEARLWLTPADREPLTIALFNGGMTIRAIAAVLGVGVASVHRDLPEPPDYSVFHCGTRNIPQESADPDTDAPAQCAAVEPMSRRRLSDVDVALRKVQAYALDARGVLQAQIAARLGLRSQGTVSKYKAEVERVTLPSGPGDRALLDELLADAGDDVESIDPAAAARALGVQVVDRTPQPVAADPLGQVMAACVDGLERAGDALERALEILTAPDSTPAQRELAAKKLAAADSDQTLQLLLQAGRVIGRPCPGLDPAGGCRYQECP